MELKQEGCMERTVSGKDAAQKWKREEMEMKKMEREQLTRERKKKVKEQVNSSGGSVCEASLM